MGLRLRRLRNRRLAHLRTLPGDHFRRVLFAEFKWAKAMAEMLLDFAGLLAGLAMPRPLVGPPRFELINRYPAFTPVRMRLCNHLRTPSSKQAAQQTPSNPCFDAATTQCVSFLTDTKEGSILFVKTGDLPPFASSYRTNQS